MFVFFPIVCPSCRREVFFYKQNLSCSIYGVVEQLAANMPYHPCPVIEGKNYWLKIDLKKYLSLDPSCENLLNLTKNYPVFKTKKDNLAPEVGLLIRIDEVNQEQHLLILTSDFHLFEFLINSKRKLSLGTILKLQTVTKLSQNLFRVAKIIEFKTSEASIDKDHINKNIFSCHLKSEDLNCLEAVELDICKKLQKDQRLLAIYPLPYKSEHSRIITFFVKNKNSLISLLENIVLPSKIKMSLAEKKLPRLNQL